MRKAFRISVLLTLLVSVLLSLSVAACAETLELPADLIEIGDSAFYGDSSLDEVVVPEGVTDIGPRAFARSGVKRIVIPDTVTAIGRDAFAETDAVICSSENSYARQYADRNGLRWEDSNPPETVYLTLAHNLATDHPVHLALSAWAQALAEESGGSIVMSIAPRGERGNEYDCVYQIQTGQLEMAKVSAGTLSNYRSAWNCVSVPYVFKDKDHLYNVMNGEIGRDLYKLTEKDGFIGLAWLESGSRCFYTVWTPIRTPSDLRGRKIRTMNSQMAIDMMEALGGTAVIMAYNDLKSAMQQGVIDGAENNVTAMRDHADVTRYYCYDEHTMIPDVIVISTDIWNRMSAGQQEIMRSTALDMVANYRELWAQFEESVKASVQGKVEYVTDVDKAAFREAVQPLYQKLSTDNPAAYAFVERILAAG